MGAFTLLIFPKEAAQYGAGTAPDLESQTWGLVPVCLALIL